MAEDVPQIMFPRGRLVIMISCTVPRNTWQNHYSWRYNQSRKTIPNSKHFPLCLIFCICVVVHVYAIIPTTLETNEYSCRHICGLRLINRSRYWVLQSVASEAIIDCRNEVIWAPCLRGNGIMREKSPCELISHTAYIGTIGLFALTRLDCQRSSTHTLWDICIHVHLPRYVDYLEAIIWGICMARCCPSIQNAVVMEP